MRIRELILISDSSIQFWKSEIELYVKINSEIKSFLKWKFENLVKTYTTYWVVVNESEYDFSTSAGTIRISRSTIYDYDVEV